MHRRERMIITDGGGIVTLPNYIDYISLYDALTDDSGVGNHHVACRGASRITSTGTQHGHFIAPSKKSRKKKSSDEEWEVIECDVSSKIIKCSEVLSSCKNQSSKNTHGSRTHNCSTSSTMSNSTDNNDQITPPEFFNKCAFYDYEVVDMKSSQLKSQ